MLRPVSMLLSVRLVAPIALAGATVLGAAPPAAAQQPAAAEFSAKQAAWERRQALARATDFPGLEWRSIGPVVQGGRIVDVESVPGEPYSFYVAYASGGVWKTTNNGVTFEPLSDDQPTMIVGDLALDPQNPRTIWLGTGENNSSRSSYGGLGVFRSDDGGKTWRAMGLEETDRIGRVLVDPRDSNRVWVAAIGKLYTKGGLRGVFRTDDGGKSWTHVLDTATDDGETGAIDLAMDPKDPDTLYAAAWQRSRRPWNFVEGGEGSGIWKTTDGGATWTRLAGGFPGGKHVGRIGLAVYPQDPSILYASVDNQELLPEEQWDLGDAAVTAKRLRSMTKEEFLAQDPEAIEDFIRGNDLDTTLTAEKLIGMVRRDEITLADLLKELDDANANLFETDIKGLEIWRSDDAGATWRKTHDEPIRDVVYTYGYYFGQVRVAPDDPDTVYAVGVPLIKSTDGGKTWTGIDGREVHVDHHEVWIDPAYPDRVISGNDGGLDVSYDGGESWVKIDRQAVGQFYTINVDLKDPYNVYGGTQDNGTLRGSSRARPGRDEWDFVGGGDGMYVQIDPRDGTLYTGFQFGFYFRSGPDGAGPVRPRDGLGEPALRYNWSTPVILSSHNPDIVYFGANRLYRSMDRGKTWTAISEDLSRSPERGDVPFGTITTLSESELAFGRIWAGTDDGQVWITPDGGATWRDARAGLPPDRWVSRVEASRHVADRAYLSLNGYRDDDPTSHVYVTEDLGKTWTRLAGGPEGGLPAEPVNVVREDPVNPDVLWVGTDRGVYVSLDRGASWQAPGSGLPNVPVHDLVVHPRERELVAGTHGRSIWILDALPVQDLTPDLRKEPVHVFPVEDAQFSRGWRGRRSLWFYDPEDDPEVRIPFWTAKGGTAELRVLDADDRLLRSLELGDLGPGVHTFVWDLLLDEERALAAEEARLKAEWKKAGKEAKEKPPTRADTPWAEAVRLGWPLHVTPGTYALEVRVGDASHRTEWTVKPPEPREPRAEPEPPIRGRDAEDEGEGGDDDGDG